MTEQERAKLESDFRQTPITAEALAAHNRGAEEPCANDCYNHAKKLGTHRERLLLRLIAEWHSTRGDRRRRLTRAEVNTYQRIHRPRAED